MVCAARCIGSARSRNKHAGLGTLNARRIAYEQLRVQALLEIADILTDGRLRHPQSTRGGVDGAAFGDLKKGPDVGPIKALACWAAIQFLI
jgi:hypothetical protein